MFPKITKTDLGIKPPVSRAAPFPGFNSREVTVSQAPVVLGAAGTVDLLKNQGASTIQWALVVSSQACTLQLLQDGQPVGMAFPVNAGAVIRFAGRFLPNNAKLSISASAATSISFEVAWVKEYHFDLMELATTISYGPATSPATQPISGQVGLNKNTTIETQSPLAGNATFTGPWHDSQVDGTTFVIVSSFSNVIGAASGLSVDLSDDINNANFTRAGVISIQPAAATLTSLLAPIRARYWRVVYHNGATIQASLEVTACAMDSFLPIVSGGGTLPAANFSGMTVSNSQGAVGIGGGSGTDNLTTWVVFGGPAPANLLMYGGAFSGTADLVRQGASKARTPTVFKVLTTAATGSTAIWTPGTGNKFRLLKYRIIVNASAIMAAATDLTIKLLDAALDIGQDYIVRIPAAALGSGVNYDTGWVDLGTFGILSAAANNALNANLSAALTGGLISFLVAGVEE